MFTEPLLLWSVTYTVPSVATSTPQIAKKAPPNRTGQFVHALPEYFMTICGPDQGAATVA